MLILQLNRWSPIPKIYRFVIIFCIMIIFFVQISIHYSILNNLSFLPPCSNIQANTLIKLTLSLLLKIIHVMLFQRFLQICNSIIITLTHLYYILYMYNIIYYL